MTQNGKLIKDAMERLTNPKNAPVPRNKTGMMFMQNGGGLLSKSVTCSSCGWSWKSVQGGLDPLTCHKCGGMVKMDKGGQNNGPGPKKPQQLPTIYVDNPKDPRLRAYNDSLNAYNAGEDMYKFGKDVYNQVRSPKNKEFRNNYDIRRVNIKERSPFMDTNIYPVESYDETYDRKPGSFWEQNVKDNRPNYYIGNNGEHWAATGTGWSRFKKPVQPVVYKESESPYVKKFGLTNEDVKRAFATKPISKKNGDPYYNLSKGGKNYKIHAQSGGLDYIEEVVVSKPQPKKQESVKENQPVAQQPIAKQAVASPAPVRQYTGSPVYSPGAGSGMPSALVGFRSEAGDTAFIQPDDYQRFAVPAYGRDYIQSQVKKFAGGGQTRNEREMVNGIADILSQVNDTQNRAQIARQMVQDFNNEDVTYDYDKFMTMSNLADGEMEEMARGGYVVTRSNDRKGKTHKVTGPDGTVKYFGDSKLGQHPKDPERKAAFYARHKKNLDGNPFFRAFARKTWADGGEISPYDMFDESLAMAEMSKGGQHGGLDRWFAEKWVDVKTGKDCGRQEGEKRAGYPACRPSRRVNDDTPKTSSELSSSEREKFKRSKTSSDRINYQHRRKEDGGEINETDMANKPNNPSLWSKAKSLARQKFDVYPSAYANGWAAKWYKGKGGTWSKAEYGMQVMGEGGTNNPGFEALPPYVQAKILSNMGLGGYYNPYMEDGGSTYSGNAFYGDGGMYPMYDEAGPVDPNGRFHGEWQDDPMLAEQFGYSQDMSEDEMLASQDAANVAANPMKPTKIKVDTPKALPGKKGQGSGSIVDFLNSQGAKSDFATRKAVAENVYGFGKYTGSAEQNKRLLAIMSGKEGYSQPQKAYNQNDGNMLRKGFDPSFDARSPQFGKAPAQGSIPQGNYDSFDARYPQFGTNFGQGVPAQAGKTAAKQAAQSQPAGKKKPLFGKTADEFIAADPYFFAEESDGNFVKALDYPFTALRNAGARVVLDQDPMALFSLLAAGAGSRGLIGKTKTMPYNPRQIGASGRMAGQKALPGRPAPTGWSTASGLRSGQYPMRAEGGYVEGQEMDVTPEEMERLRQQGYQFEII